MDLPTADRHDAAVSLPVIHMFWHGAKLSRIERLCMASFVAHGHVLKLHTYDDIDGAPAGVSRVDAAQVLPRHALFRHPKTGSLAQFADWFRYRVLHEQGGIWADTDVVCLKPLHYAQPEVFAWQDDSQINNAVLGLPRGHELAEWMARGCESPNRFLPYDDARSKRRKVWRWLTGNRRGNVKWGEYGPLGFTHAARHLGYADLALPPVHFYAVPYKQWREIFEPGAREWSHRLLNARALHLWNEMMRRERGFDKNGRFAPESLFEQLCARYLTNDN